MPETADRTESLFAAAVAMAPEERGAYLERECSGDPALRDRVLALLKARDHAGHVIDRPVNGDPDQTAGYVSTIEQPGTVIAGRYKLLEEIGQGGMGTVWAAEQTTPVRRKVALKLIKAGMDSRAVLARFEAERQALALMDHPNIAKVLDGGLTDSGRPYFVMEYVKGVPITDYCDATRLSVEERLNLFVQVCSALQHAHQKGIIHRDLKPSNILVAPYDDKPVPKVIDFGLAKAMHQSLTEKTLYTAHETVLGTPLYMSPEQAQLNNLDVDTRADIYSLGVLLYELLTGTTPIERRRFKEAAWDEVRRMIREEDPPAPSTRLSTTDTLPSLATFRHTEPAKLKKLVRGELDWIVMKALEKDRTRRYETANGLARDIQRYLDDEVVEARPPSTGYRISKIVRRHKGQVIAASMVLLALLAGIAGTTWGLIREARANSRLAESLDREKNANADLSDANDKVKERYDLAVEAIQTFHTGVGEDFLLKEEKFKDLRNRLLNSASDFYGKLSVLLGKETDFASRQALAQSNFELAELTRKVGRAEAALAAHRAVFATREALAAEPGAGVGVRTDIGRSLTAIASVLGSTTKADEAIQTYRRAESLLAGLADRDPAARSVLANCRTRMARVLIAGGRYSDALATLKLAITEQKILATGSEVSNDIRRDLAHLESELGVLLLNVGKPADAAPEIREAVAILKKLVHENPGVAEFGTLLAAIQSDLGNVLFQNGQAGEAEVELRTALAGMRKRMDANPAVRLFRANVAFERMCLGRVLLVTAQPAAAEEILAALATTQKLVDEDHGDAVSRCWLALIHNYLGVERWQMGRLGEAETEFRTALAIQQKLADESPSIAFFRDRVACCLIYLGDVVRSRGRAADAKDLYERAIAMKEDQVRADPTNLEHRYALVCSIRRRGLTHRDLGEPARAAAEVRRALALSDGLPPRSAWELLEMEVACCHAALVGLSGKAGTSVSTAEGEQAAATAMEWLHRAVANGLRNKNLIRIESALDSLRNRADFKKLMTELAKDSPPQQKKK